MHEPIESIDLMIRAAKACVNVIGDLSAKGNFRASLIEDNSIKVFCGLGNNGGDGLNIARILGSQGFKVETFIIRYSDKFSDDFLQSLDKMIGIKRHKIFDINTDHDLPKIRPNDLVIDAIFGSGLNKPVSGLAASVINHINSSKARVVAIDVPSGMFCDATSIDKNNAVIKASDTLTFQLPKLAFMFPENAEYFGNWQVLDIGLSNDFIRNTSTKYYYLTEDMIKPLLHHRLPFSHKGTYGHALIVSGSYGKMGAAVLASTACLRAGVGLLTAHIPNCGYDIMQTSIPECMIEADVENKFISTNIQLDNYDAIGVGPGIGMEESTRKFLKVLIQQTPVPMIIDADAINILAENKTWLSFLPNESIFTPHPKEFERLVGKSSDNFERMKMQQEFSFKYQCYVILKGAHTCISFPDGRCYFNSTGNPGMATAGSGDVLTGILTGLFAQGYSSSETCLLGVFLHGLAGDIARNELGEEAMIARDIIQNLSEAFRSLKFKV